MTVLEAVERYQPYRGKCQLQLDYFYEKIYKIVNIVNFWKRKTQLKFEMFLGIVRGLVNGMCAPE